MLRSWISRYESQDTNTSEYERLEQNQSRIGIVLKSSAVAITLMVIAIAVSCGLTLIILNQFIEKEYAENRNLIYERLQTQIAEILSKDKRDNDEVNFDSILNNAKSDLIRLTKDDDTTQGIKHSSLMRYLEEIVLSVSIISDNDIVHFSTDRQLLDKSILPAGDNLRELQGKEYRAGSKNRIFIKDRISYVVLPIESSSRKDIAKVVIVLQKHMSDPREDIWAGRSTEFLILFTLLGITVLTFYLVHKILTLNSSGAFFKSNITRPTFLIVTITQIACLGVLLEDTKSTYVDKIKIRSEYLLGEIKDDIQLLVNPETPRGLKENKVRDLIDYLNRFKEIDNLVVNNIADKVVIKLSREGNLSYDTSSGELPNELTSGDETFIKKVLFSTASITQGLIIINISRSYVYKAFSTLILDLITIIGITTIFSAELIVLLNKYLDKLLTKLRLNPGFHYSAVRPTVFLFLFGIDLSMSFLPLHMEKLYEPIFGLAKDVVMGLPVSIEFLCVGVAILASGFWLDRRGWYEPLISGLLLASLGSLYSWLAPDALHFIASRAVVGIGYGLALMATQGCVISNTDDSNKGQALAYWIGGIYAGSICGSAIGAFCAEWFDYRVMFSGGALILLGVVVYTVIFLKGASQRLPNFQKKDASYRRKPNHLRSFFCDRNILSLIFFSSLPAAIAAVGFLNYFSPIYLNRIGVSQSTIGQVLMIYGICMIYLGPRLGKLIDVVSNKRMIIFAGCLIGGLAFLTFNILNGVMAAVVAVFLLGLSNSLVLTSQSTYALRLRVAKELGEGAALGIFRATSRIGQMLGPLIFSGVVMTADVEKSMTLFGLVYLITALLFLLLKNENE